MNETLSKVLNHPARVPVVVGALMGFGSGLVTGYILALKQVKSDNDASKEVDEDFENVKKELAAAQLRREARESVAKRVQEENQSEETRPSSGDKLVEQLKSRGKTTVIPLLPAATEEEEVEVVRQSVFARTDDAWDYEVEKRNRHSTATYVLHKDEYFAEELGFRKRTFTYYVGDNVMYDENEKHPVYNYEQVVGALQFGHGSGDPSVFYIRNMQEKCEIEIFLDEGLYALERGGVDPEDFHGEHIRHGDPVPKMRRE